ncbi:uncharacterized protein LOC115919458 [Strongylocentrotus purpuratus]|uniref:EMI domain-containing protein n=1 Tax=Strongylocentrotus purpuratus TaxID=7668 RepID=A0A7M7N1E0_STRPU|nr:uncharacterized protein LOC115919458 [Strongylocentrotus purpuratus]
MEFHLLACWCFMLVMSRLMTSHALSHGPGRCWNTISALITVRETFAESKTKRTATCCDWFCISKCSSYRMVYRTAYRNALRTMYKIDLGCCPGWRPQEGHCVPASIPDGRAEATLVPFLPGRPQGEPRSSGAHQGDTGTSSHTVEQVIIVFMPWNFTDINLSSRRQPRRPYDYLNDHLVRTSRLVLHQEPNQSTVSRGYRVEETQHT